MLSEYLLYIRAMDEQEKISKANKVSSAGVEGKRGKTITKRKNCGNCIEEMVFILVILDIFSIYQ